MQERKECKKERKERMQERNKEKEKEKKMKEEKERKKERMKKERKRNEKLSFYLPRAAWKSGFMPVLQTWSDPPTMTRMQHKITFLEYIWF